MSTTPLSEHKLSRSVPWEDYLYPTLRDPKTAWDYLETAIEDPIPGEVCLTLRHVIEANKDLPFIAYQVICAYSRHLAQEDIPVLVDALQKAIAPEHQTYLADLYWWLDTLKEQLARGTHWLQIEARPLDAPEELKGSIAYQQWKQVA